MIRYLPFSDEASADARSRAAWAPGAGDSVTVRMWDVVPYPADGRAALAIPDGGEIWLTVVEQAALVDTIPGSEEGSS